MPSRQAFPAIWPLHPLALRLKPGHYRIDVETLRPRRRLMVTFSSRGISRVCRHTNSSPRPVTASKYSHKFLLAASYDHTRASPSGSARWASKEKPSVDSIFVNAPFEDVIPSSNPDHNEPVLPAIEQENRGVSASEDLRIYGC